MKDVMFLGKMVAEVVLNHTPVIETLIGIDMTVKRRDIIDIEFRGIELSYAEVNSINGRIYENKVITLAKLGPSIICSNCGYVVKPGVRCCLGCGSGFTEIVNDSKYLRMGRFAFAALNAQQSYGKATLVDIKFRLLGEMTLYAFEEEMRNPFAGWLTTHIVDGWICRYCNAVNSDNYSNCVGCGAGQLPFSNVESLRTHCLYCGSNLKWATVCEGCGSAGSGYRIWPARLDWQ